jgi:HSP20 family protein
MMRINTNPWKLMDAVLADFERTGKTTRSNSETDVFETADAVLVKVNLPGVSPENVELNLERNVLTLTAKLEENTSEGTKVLWRERATGEQKRVVQIPVRILHDNIEANLENGVLTVKIPKAPESLSKRIAINSIQS